MTNVIREPAYLVGNSLGGFVSVMAASGPRQDLVKGLILLNATPFWSGAPNPATDPQAAALMPWSGALPAPWLLRLVVGVWWSLLRSPATVRALLGLVYSDGRRVDDALVERFWSRLRGRRPGRFSAASSSALARRSLLTRCCGA